MDYVLLDLLLDCEIAGSTSCRADFGVCMAQGRCT